MMNTMSLPFRRKQQQPQHQHAGNNSMYTAFLLDNGDQLKYRLFTGVDGDEAAFVPGAAGAVPGQQPAGATTAPPAADEENAGGGGAAAVPYKQNAAAVSCSGWFSLTRRHINILNIVAALVHAMLLVIVYVMSKDKEKKIWRLKQDRVQVVSKSVGDANPFVKISNEKCNAAKPNVLDYSNADAALGVMQMWSYPQVCVVVFYVVAL